MSGPRCDLTLLVIGPVCTVIGGVVLAVAIALWVRPESRFARAVLQPWRPFDVADLAPPRRGAARRATMQLAMMRVLLPIVGAVFLAGGCYLITTILRCEARI